MRTGCQWRHLPPPPAFPPRRTVYGYMRAFLRDGVWESIRHHFVVMLREGAGREASPTAAVIDTQSVKATESGGPRGGTPPPARPGLRSGGQPDKAGAGAAPDLPCPDRLRPRSHSPPTARNG